MLPLRGKESGDFFYVPDLGLGYLAAALRSRLGEKVKITIMAKNLQTPENEFKNFLKKNEFDVIGLKVFSSSITNARRTITLIRGAVPEAVIVAGGPHATAMPRLILEHLDADYAIAGDGETPFLNLMRCLAGGGAPEEFLRIEGLIWKENGKILCNKEACLEDLDSFGTPSWDLIAPSSFSRYQTRKCRRYPAAPILLTRGCLNNCTFCGRANTCFRKRDIGKIIAELRFLMQSYKVREFCVCDDNCAYDRKYFTEFCRALIKEKLDLIWRIPGGICVNSVNSELCGLLKRSGCYEVWLGIESGSQNILNAMKKGVTVKRVFEVTEIMHAEGLKTGGFFVFGYPGETDEDRRQTMSLALKLPLDYVLSCVFYPDPGAEIFKTLQNSGRMERLDELFCSSNQYLNRFTNLSPKGLMGFQHKFSLRFYGRPKVILNLIREYFSFAGIIYLFRVAVRFVIGAPSW